MPAHPTVSAVWPLNVAIAAAIEAARAAEVENLGTPLDLGDDEADPPTEEGPIALDSPAVYSGQVPQGTSIVSAYVVLSASQQSRGRGTFRRKALENVETLDVWTADQSKRTAGLIGDALIRLLDGVDLVLAGYGTVRGRCEMVITLADPSTQQYRSQLRYTAVSLSPEPAP